MFTRQPVSLVEYAVFRRPEGLEGWRLYRIEYGGHAENCITEGSIWLPPNLSPQALEDGIQFYASQGEPDTRSRGYKIS